MLMKRPSITSTGGDESSTFTIVGTDMSGNPQTEVITGPASSATAIGSKTFKTITSITPSANTTGSVTLGFSGAGVTTTGVTGSAKTALVCQQIFIIINLLQYLEMVLVLKSLIQD